MTSDNIVKKPVTGEEIGEIFNQKEGEEEDISTEVPVLYNDSGYNRNKTLIAQFVNRIIKDFPTPTERYYDIRMVPAIGRRSYFGEVGDQCVMFHSNKIALITLAPTHPIIVEDKTIVKIDFTFEGHSKINRLNNELRGRHKKGGQKLQRYAPICSITCSDDIKHIIVACIPSRLLEINEALQTNFNLLKSRPLSEGFIAIVQPNDRDNMDKHKTNFHRLGQDVQNIAISDIDDCC